MTFDLVDLCMPYLFIFARFSAAFMMAPGISDTNIPAQYRLFFSLAISLCLRPLLPDIDATHDHLTLIFILGYEVLMGLLIGFCMRFFLALINVLGSIASVQVGLGNAMVFNPSLGAQASVVEHFFMVCGVFLFFASDCHHVFIQTCFQSYASIPPFNSATAPSSPILSSILQTLPYFLNYSFNMACQLALPFLILGMVFQSLLGMLSRIVPTFQVFFIALPLQMGLGFLLLSYIVAPTLRLSLEIASYYLKPFS